MRTSSLLPLVAPLFVALPACGSAKVIDKLSGTVVDRMGAPAAGARVRVGESLATTDAAGHFTVSAVPRPYDVTLFPKDTQAPYTFLGLTGAEPTLRVYDRYLNPAKDGQGATLSLDLPVDPGSNDHFSFVIDRPDDLSPIEVAIANPTASGKMSVGLWWPGQKPTTVRIQALRFTADAGGMAHYTGYDSVLLPLAAGDKPTWTASWKAPPFEETKLSVSVKVPDGYAIWQCTVNMRPENGPSGGIVAWSMTPSTDMTFVVPDVEGAVFDVTVCAGGAASSSCRTLPGLTKGTAAALSVDEGPTLLSPGSGEIVGAGSTVQWSAGGEGASFLFFYPSGYPSTAPWYFIASGDEEATIPDLGELGVELPWGAQYNLGVFRNGSLATVDDLAKEGPMSTPPGQPFTYAYSNTVVVTTH